MQTPHQCAGCLSRRRCLQIISTAAAGLTFSGGILPALAKSRKADPDFVDPTRLRPKPKVRLDAAILQQPRPYWLGWPGTTYNLDQRQKEYRGQLAASCRRLAIDLHEEDKPIEDEAAMTAFLKAVRERKPDGLLVILQHMNCWSWVNRLANEAGIPIIVFSPIGTSFTGHVAGISRQPGVYVVSSLEWSAVEDSLRMIRAKRMFEETRVLWIQGNQRNETVLDRLVTSHCVSGTRLNGFGQKPAPYILRSHSESGLGISVQVLWPVAAPVSLIRFQNPGELIVDTGTVVSNINTPPAGGCRTSVEIKMDTVEDLSLIHI